MISRKAHMLRAVVLASAVAGFAMLSASREAAARPLIPWCVAETHYAGSLDCSYYTFRQCLETLSGLGGQCVHNPRLGPWVPQDAYFYDDRRHSRKYSRQRAR